jgi:hypothetical protein
LPLVVVVVEEEEEEEDVKMQGQTAPSYRLHEGNKDDTSGFEEWDSKQLAAYLAKAGLGEYSEMFIGHKVTGRLAPLLSDLDLKEMGMSIIGDRLRMKSLILTLGRSVRYNTRTKTIWEATERIYFSDAEQCFWTCCGLFPDGTYKILWSVGKVLWSNRLIYVSSCVLVYPHRSIDIQTIDQSSQNQASHPCTMWPNQTMLLLFLFHQQCRPF